MRIPLLKHKSKADLAPDDFGEGKAPLETTTATMERRKAERIVGGMFALTALASVAFVVAYVMGNNTQVFGICFAVALGALGLGLLVWTVRLVDAPEVAEDRHPWVADPAKARALEQDFLDNGVRDGVVRRKFLVRMLALAGGALALPIVVSLRGLGAAPGTSLRDTHWKAGNRLVTPEGTPIKADAMVQDQVWTVFPEGSGNAADSQALLIKTRPDLLRLPADRMAWTVDGVVCYSKLCTHAGCPLAIYRPSTKSLFCPCHQSQFDVLNGGKPYFGPAARALPQLPIRVDEQGYFVAEGEFSAPVGPAYWERS